jgi:hypothetical protein
LREEFRLRVLENRVQRRIFGIKRDELTGVRRKLHIEVLNDLYCSPETIRVIKSRRMRWMGHVALKGERRGSYRPMMEQSKVKRALGRLRHRYKDNIKIYLKEMGWEIVERFDLAQDKDK